MEALAGAGVWLGMAIGFVAGMAFQAFRHAVQNLRKTQESIPGFKKAVSQTRRRWAFRLFLGVGYAALVVWMIVYVK